MAFNPFRYLNPWGPVFFKQDYLSGSPQYSRTSADLSKFEGTEYYDQAKAIADKYSNKQYSPNFMARVAQTFLDDYSGQDNFYQELDMQRDAELQQLLDSMRVQEHQEGYQDPSAEAARMRAAGQNPDLMGTSGAQGGAAAVPADETPPGVFDPHSSDSSLNDLFNSALSVTGLITTGIDIAGLVRDFSHQGRMNALQELQSLATSQPGLTKLLASIAPGFGDDTYVSGSNAGVGEDTGIPGYSPMKDNINTSSVTGGTSSDDIIEGFPVSKQAKKVLRELRGRLGFQVDVDKYRAEQLQAKVDAAEKQLMLDINKESYSALKEVGKLQVDLAKLKTEYDKKMYSSEAGDAAAAAAIAQSNAAQQQAEFEGEYFDKLNPELAAGATNQEAVKRQYEADRDAKIAKMESIVEGFYEHAINFIQSSDLPEDLKMTKINAVYTKRNEFYSGLNAYRIKLATEAGKSVGDTDLLDLFTGSMSLGSGFLTK